jgi:hypothetical protein
MSKERGRLGDSFRELRISDALKKRYLCDHVKAGAQAVKRYDTPYGIVATCEQCQSLETLRLTVAGEVLSNG